MEKNTFISICKGIMSEWLIAGIDNLWVKITVLLGLLRSMAVLVILRVSEGEPLIQIDKIGMESWSMIYEYWGKS